MFPYASGSRVEGFAVATAPTRARTRDRRGRRDSMPPRESPNSLAEFVEAFGQFVAVRQANPAVLRRKAVGSQLGIKYA